MDSKGVKILSIMMPVYNVEPYLLETIVLLNISFRLYRLFLKY